MKKQSVLSTSEKPLAYDAYEQLADAYAAKSESKPHNAYYDRPAVMGLWPNLKGKRVLDAGCGPGVYAEAILKRGGEVVAIDISDRMLAHARERLHGRAEVRKVDMEQPLGMFSAGDFDMVNAPLCLDYIRDWDKLFAEFFRVLKPGGVFVVSTGHPSFDAEYYRSKKYFEVEPVESDWNGFGIKVRMPSYRRSIEKHLMAFIGAGFVFEKIVEPLPTADFRRTDPRNYAKLMHRPGFICVRAGKPL